MRSRSLLLCVFACVSPDAVDVDETLSSLRFAARAKLMARNVQAATPQAPAPGSPGELVWLRDQRRALAEEVRALRERVDRGATSSDVNGTPPQHLPFAAEVALNAAVLAGAAWGANLVWG